jgi:hypothetical protein
MKKKKIKEVPKSSLKAKYEAESDDNDDDGSNNGTRAAFAGHLKHTVI